MEDDNFQAVPLTPRQKRWMRIGLSLYLVFMGTYTLLHNDFAASTFYALLSTFDFYFYLEMSQWVRLKVSDRRKR